MKRTDDPPHVAFYSLRDTEFPDIELKGLIEPLDVDDQARIAEPTHACFFPDGVMGVLGSQGPRSAAIARYIENKTGLKVAYQALIRAELLHRLDRQDEIKMFDIKLKAGNVQAVADASADVASALATFSDYTGDGTVEVLLKARPRSIESRESMSSKVKGLVHQLVDGELMDRLEKAQVTGRSSEAGEEVINLLEDHITVQQLVDVTGARRISDGEALRAIRAAYATAYTEIRAVLASGV